MQVTTSKTLVWIVLITMVAGTLDALAAIFIYKADPVRLFQLIASGALGREKGFAGGTNTFLLGMVFHYLIAAAWTTLFFILNHKLKWIRKNRLVVIFGYGLLIWVVMNIIVLPLSQLGGGPFSMKSFFIAAGILVFAVSLPIVLLTARACRTAPSIETVVR
jgi:hypothetical protein